MNPICSVCVFCGSRVGNNPAFVRTAEQLGALLVAENIGLVYGGGGFGLMGVVAAEVLKCGGRVTGVMPRFLKNQEVGMEGLTETIHVGSMHERKQRMFDLSDGFLVLPGGLGTLDEAIEILAWKQLRLHDKPLVFIDQGGYWSAFSALMDKVIEGGFASSAIRDQFAVAQDVESSLTMLRSPPGSGVFSQKNRL